jgi:glucosamine 6-phosphate synthetase-like amidotransferase/phosphosugar isomerase protein
MCGIVAYFGGAGNHLTRVLTGMSAIIYRAPDSTGLGLHGDENEPIRTRKSLGAVGKLVRELARNPAYPDRGAKLLAALNPSATEETRLEWRRVLRRMEGLPETEAGAEGPPGYDDLVRLPPETARRLYPGAGGEPGAMPVFGADTPEALADLVEKLVQTYDLSPVVIQSLYRRALEATLVDFPTPETVAPPDLLHLFEQVLEGLSTPHSPSLWAETASLHPEAWEALWRLMAVCPLAVPEDYDRDGVRGVFRLLDGALLSRIPVDPGLQERMTALLQSLWPEAASAAPLAWYQFYQMEKAANLFGWAASAALHALQQEMVLPMLAGDPDSAAAAAAVIPGVTDALSLRLIATPIIAHGRWALQSPVTLANCHPFLDRTRQRAIAVNGQFDAGVEARLKRYLKNVAGFSFRSENSGEYFSLLWGYYFQILRQEQQRFEAIREQTEEGMIDLSIGSQAIDYQIYHAVHQRDQADLDEMAFVAAVRQMMQHGGQIAVIGLSRVSSRRLYVAANNRPIFVVRRQDNHDVMVVSDINAAIGLFPQKLIYTRCRELMELARDREQAIARMRGEGAPQARIDALRHRFDRDEDALCRDFGVEIFPLEGENHFARIDTVMHGGKIRREVSLANLQQEPIRDIDPIVTTLKPPQVRRDLYASLFVSHQREIPDRLEDLLRTYMPREGEKPEPGLNQKLFQRRFGPRFQSLRRIVLVGCGTSFHMALVAQDIFRRYLPQLETVAVDATAFDLLARSLSPERDLAILVSWSGTTAEMVELAKLLVRRNIVTAGVTEKRFSDMALVLAKSGGLMLCLSGEEVTVAAVKSAFSLAFSLAILAVWVARERGRSEAAQSMAAIMRQLPHQIRQLQADEAMQAFCARMAAAYGDASACLVIDAVHRGGTGREAAMKLEETSWTSVSRAVDFQDLPGDVSDLIKARTLVLVNATGRGRIAAALEAMRRLHEADIDFIAVSYASRESGQVERFSRGRAFWLPKIQDCFQPFLDLVFHYELAYQYGISHGQTSEGFPRNRAKSVTVARSRPADAPSPQAAASALPSPSRVEPQVAAASQNGIGGPGAASATARYVEDLQRMAVEPEWQENAGSKALRESLDPAGLARRLFDDLPPDGTLLLATGDRMAHAAALSAAAQWKPFLPCGLRVERLGDLRGRLVPQTLVLACGTRVPAPALLSRLLDTAGVPAAWIGPAPDPALERRFNASAGMLPLPETASPAAADALYLAFCHLLAAAWRSRDPNRGKILSDHLRLLPETLHAVLADEALKAGLAECFEANHAYETAFYIGPPGGNGLLWEDAFACHGRLVVVPHVFGEAAHGPIVTVDGRAAQKFIPLEKRDIMVAAYGKETVARWEREFLGGIAVDDFNTVAQLPGGLFPSPFFAEGCWYLPVLRRDYDTRQDNLILLDASSQRHFNLALDELSVFGCRYARLAVIIQSALGRRAEIEALQVQPVSHFIQVPGITALQGTLSELLLPVVSHLVAITAADLSHRRHDRARACPMPRSKK